jgi:hypothetical protein
MKKSGAGRERELGIEQDAQQLGVGLGDGDQGRSSTWPRHDSLDELRRRARARSERGRQREERSWAPPWKRAGVWTWGGGDVKK